MKLKKNRSPCNVDFGAGLMASAGASESAWRLESSTVSSFLMRLAIEAGWALEHKKKVFKWVKLLFRRYIHKSKKSVFLLFFFLVLNLTYVENNS